MIINILQLQRLLEFSGFQIQGMCFGFGSLSVSGYNDDWYHDITEEKPLAVPFYMLLRDDRTYEIECTKQDMIKEIRRIIKESLMETESTQGSL